MKSGLKYICWAAAILVVFLFGNAMYQTFKPMDEETEAFYSELEKYNKITQDSNKLLEDMRSGNYSSSVSDEEVYAYMESLYYELLQKENPTQEDLNKMKVYRVMLAEQGIDVAPFESSVTTDATTATPPQELGVVLLYEDEYVAIRFDKITHEKLVPWMPDELSYVYLYVTNKSEGECKLLIDSLAINGLSYNDISGWESVAPQSTGNVKFSTSTALPIQGIERLSGSFTVYPMNDSVYAYEITFSNIEIQ